MAHESRIVSEYIDAACNVVEKDAATIAIDLGVLKKLLEAHAPH